MLHSEYKIRVFGHFLSRRSDAEFRKSEDKYRKERDIMLNLNTDPVISLLKKPYAPKSRRPPRDAVCMLRSLILMTVCRERSITKWVEETRTVSVLAILAGFDPDDTPGVGTYYDFMKRIIDSPYRKPCEHIVKRSLTNAGSHERNLRTRKEAKKDDQDPNCSQSEKLVKELLPRAGEPRSDMFPKILEDIHILIGIIPYIEQELLTLEETVFSGDGSILATAASSNGKPTCNCRQQGIYKCDHPVLLTSPTAEWCYDHHRKCFVFGDRYYHLIVTCRGHDFILLTLMPGGNKSDYTLSLEAIDRLLKALQEHGLNFNLTIFCGDGHHDSHAHYQYLREKNIIPIIPLSKKSKHTYPHPPGCSSIRFDTDGTPLCPGGARLRHHQYDKAKRKHVYVCPIKRQTHRSGKTVYVTHTEQCPLKKDCMPESPLGPFVYLKSDIDPRLFPPIPRGSKRFKKIYNERGASERINFINDVYNIDKAHRNPDYGLIRLVLANIVHHACISYQEMSGDDFPTDTLFPIPSANPDDSESVSQALCPLPLPESASYENILFLPYEKPHSPVLLLPSPETVSVPDVIVAETDVAESDIVFLPCLPEVPSVQCLHSEESDSSKSMLRDIMLILISIFTILFKIGKFKDFFPTSQQTVQNLSDYDMNYGNIGNTDYCKHPFYISEPIRGP